MMRAVALVGGFLAIAAPARAQAPADSGIVEVRLGGDSAQATRVTLRARGVYHVVVTPARASVLILPVSSGGGRPLTARPLADVAPPEGGSAFTVEVPHSGEYIVELTNPGVGLTRVRVVRDHPLSRYELLAAAARSQYGDEVTVFSETFPGPYETITLLGRTAYRIEIAPAGAVVSIRSVTSASAPPMVMRPLSEAATAAGGASFVLFPSNTDQYRIDVTGASDLVRVRIIKDPREQAILEGRAHSALAQLTLGVRGAFLSGTLLSGAASVPSPAGWEACLGLAPGLIAFAPRLGGCAITYTRYALPNGASLVLMGFEPRYELWSNGSLSLSLAADVAIAGKITYAGSCEALAVGPHVAWQPLPRVPLVLDLEPALAVIQQEDVGSGPTLVRGRTQALRRIVAGLHVRL